MTAFRGTGFVPDAQRVGGSGDWSADGELLGTAVSPDAAATTGDLMPPVFDQGGANSCVAWGFVELLFAHHRLQGIAKPEPASALLPWYHARATENMQGFNAGTSPRAVCDMARLFGFCRERHWPYRDEAYDQDPPPRAARSAADQREDIAKNTRHKKLEYRRLHAYGVDRVDVIKAAIMSRRPVMAGFGISKAFASWECDFSKPLLPPSQAEWHSNHLLVPYAYVGDTFVMRNSWGWRFGNGGDCLFSAEYIAEAVDPWIIVNAPYYSDIT